MKQRDVQVGGVYKVKVSGRVVPVRVLSYREGRAGLRRRYAGTNLVTGRTVYFTAAKCRSEVVEVVGAVAAATESECPMCGRTQCGCGD